MKQKILSLLLSLLLVLLLAAPAAQAASGEVLLAADTLYTLGLLRGDGDGYQLDRAPTRLEALVMAVRLAGQEPAAKRFQGDHPFTDVPAWAEGYVAWGYANGLVKGASGGRFGTGEANAAQCASLVLWVLGYDGGDFSYATATLLACRLGLLDQVQWPAFTRGDYFLLCLRALTARIEGAETTLLQRLLEQGAVERGRANALGLAPRAPLTARQAADRLSAAVFYMDSYETEEDLAEGIPTSNASGFFISAGGLALTNPHAIAKSIWSVITTTGGEQYPVERVIFADEGLDIALLQIAALPVETAGEAGETDEREPAVFPYLTLQRSDTIHNGDIVYALGSPLGLQDSISSGIVSNRQRALEGFTLPIIQNTAPISQGSSGGVLLDQYGDAIGITSAYYIYGQSMYIAVPLDPVFDLDWTGEGMTLAEYHATLPVEEDLT